MIKRLRAALLGTVDTIGKNRKGEIVFRRSFFYRMGNTGEKFAARISSKLNELEIKHTLVDCGEEWKPFRGGQTVAQGSHFYAIVKIEE
jgi:hypothetical protein